jgi:hypothetical protein
MITGNCFSNIIELNDKENHFKDVFKFLSKTSYETTVDNINSFFTNYINNFSIIPIDDGKYHLDIVTKTNDRLRIQYQAYRLNSRGKFMYILSYKKVIKFKSGK